MFRQYYFITKVGKKFGSRTHELDHRHDILTSNQIFGRNFFSKYFRDKSAIRADIKMPFLQILMQVLIFYLK